MTRDYTDFKNFNGVLDTGTGIYTFDKLLYKNSHGKVRSWQIFLRLIKNAADIDSIDWNLTKEDQIDILPSYFDVGTKIDSHIYAQYWSESGNIDGKITRQIPTYITQPKNIGRANERNVLQCGLIECRDKFLGKKDEVADKINEGLPTNYNCNMYFPMLAKPWKDNKHLVYPVYVQPKLDGNRCLSYLCIKSDEQYEKVKSFYNRYKNDLESEDPEFLNFIDRYVIMYSRTKKDIQGCLHIKIELFNILFKLYNIKDKESIYLDGEIYKHGKSLQEITGDSRNERYTVSDNEYHIFDCFYYSKKFSFSKRLQFLSKISNLNFVKVVETHKVDNEQQAKKIYKDYIKKKYEGIILRNDDIYEQDKRSNNVIKMKKEFTEEFICIGFKEGEKGRDKGCVIWVVKNEEGKIFDVTPNLSIEERKEIYKECKTDFDKKFKNRKLTIKYEDLSNDGIPLRAKSLGFRDYL